MAKEQIEVPFENPWVSLAETEVTKTSIIASNKSMSELRAVYPKTGVFQLTCAILIEKLINELKRNNISTYAPDTFRMCLTGCTIQLGGRTTPTPTSGKGRSKSK